MNKQEFIEKLKMHGAWCTECHDINGEKDMYVKFAKVRELLEQIDEPQAEKVEVPEFVAEWLKTNKYSSDIYDLFQTVEYATDADGFIPENWKWCEEFYDWISQDSDTLYILSDAIRYGYAVKPKRWVVKVGNRYFCSFTNSEFEMSLTDYKDSKFIKTFTDKSKAVAVATLVEGSVEEV
nr:MAG TPA: Protein of unknown function (DUF1642) [Caudoviricetes sp.]